MDSPHADEAEETLALHAPATTNGMAVFALLSSLSSFVCLFGVGGVLGVVLGLIARGEVKRARGRERGRGLATTAITLGALNVCLVVVGLGVGLTYMSSLARSALFAPGPASRSAAVPSRPMPPRQLPESRGHQGPPRAGSRAPRAAHARSSRESGTRITKVGSVTLADISDDFPAQLAAQRAAATLESQTLMVWLVVPDCKPCDGVAAALSRPIAQKSLAKVRFVRVDRDEFEPELAQLGIPTDSVPGFALLDVRDKVRDFIHGGEWDADVAENIVPVLAQFALGRYGRRRHPFRGAARDDETPL